jgi:hypothetical protein
MNNNFKNQEKYSDGKYRILDITNGDVNLRRVICETEGICLIPFDTSDGKIKNIYLARYLDYLDGDHGHTCISHESTGEYSSNFDEISAICKNDLNIDCDVNDVYYLGKIQHKLPFTKSYKCYGLNLDQYSKDVSGFNLDLPKSDLEKRLYTLDKIRITRVLNGEIEDSLSMSAALLLISYINS